MATRELLIYDGTCGPCQRGAKWLSAHLRDSANLGLVSSQDLDDGALARLGLSRREVDDSLCWAGVEGTCAGSQAMTLAMARTRRPWSLLATVMRAPVISMLLARGYPIVARNRHRWPGSSSCGLDAASEYGRRAGFCNGKEYAGHDVQAQGDDHEVSPYGELARVP